MRPLTTIPGDRPVLPSPADLDLNNQDSVRRFLASLTSALEQHLAVRPSTHDPVPNQLFRSEDGTIYKLDVNPSGGVRVEPVGSVNAAPLPP